MSYCTQADLVERFGTVELAQLTDETAAAAPDASEITKACDEASSLIDAYVATLYTVPLSPVPTIVRRWACDIARKYLWKDRALAESVVALNHDAALAQLKDVARGTIALPSSAGVIPAQAYGMTSTTPTAVFNTDGLLD